MRPASDLQLTFSPMFNDLRPGPVAIISQSGALAGLMALRLGERGVGINAIVSSGNETDLTAADLLDYLGNDPQTGKGRQTRRCGQGRAQPRRIARGPVAYRRDGRRRPGDQRGVS